jgi:hypothetical protein
MWLARLNPFRYRPSATLTVPSQSSSTPTQANPKEPQMNWLSICLGLLPGIVHGIEAVVGDKASGATKAQMAQDALTVATGTAGSILNGSNATYATAASQIAGLAITQTVNIAQANGTYQKATAIATAAQQDAGVAAAVVALVNQVQNPTPATTLQSTAA